MDIPNLSNAMCGEFSLHIVLTLYHALRYLTDIQHGLILLVYMAKKKPTTEVKVLTDTSMVPVPPVRKEVVLEGDPDAQLAYATKAANALMGLVSKKKSPVVIRGKTFLEFGDWQVLARFYGATVEIEWTRPLPDGAGYEARALVKRNGEIISSAEGMVTREEKKWRDSDDYAIRSMAQTRTSAKALRNAFGWVAELAGYASTPAEEMPRDAEPMKSYKVTPAPLLKEAEEYQKETIKDLLVALEQPCDTLNMAKNSVYTLTKLDLTPKNYFPIIVALQAKMDENDPIAQHLKTIE